MSFSLLFLASSALGAESIRPFSTDGCSSFPDGTYYNRDLWLSCCIAHDLAYWKGGTFEDRQAADMELQRCVSDLGESSVSILIYIGVRAGGSPYFPTTYRWGYGWSFFRGYKELTPIEIKNINEVYSSTHNN